MKTSITWMLSAGLFLLLGLPALEAQVASSLATRDQLRTHRDSLQSALRSAEEDEVRRTLERELARTERRLEHGDFQPGDVIDLRVAGEEDWTDRFTVEDQRTLELPGLDPIPLEGLLYSEAEAHVREALSEYLRDPQVRVRPLKRIAVLGAVQEPGFYHLSAGQTVSDALMEAGGVNQDANLSDIEVERRGEELEMEDYFAYEGKTLEQLGLRSGDAVQVPTQRTWNLRNVAWAAGSVASLVGVMISVF